MSLTALVFAFFMAAWAWRVSEPGRDLPGEECFGSLVEGDFLPFFDYALVIESYFYVGRGSGLSSFDVLFYKFQIIDFFPFTTTLSFRSSVSSSSTTNCSSSMPTI